MSFGSISKRSPLYSLKEFALERKELGNESILNFNQSWELVKNRLLKDNPLHIAFYKFVLENRSSLPYEENNAYHTLLGHVLYLTGHLVDLRFMVVPSEVLLLIYQSLANFYLGKFERTKQLLKTSKVIVDTSNISLTTYVYSIRLYLELFYQDKQDLEEESQHLRNILTEYADKPADLDPNYRTLGEAILLNFPPVQRKNIDFVEKNAPNLDYWSAGLCYTELGKYYLKNGNKESAMKSIEQSIKSHKHIPNNPDHLKSYLVFFSKYKEILDNFTELEAIVPVHIEYLVKKEKNTLLGQEEKVKINNYRQLKDSLPKYFQQLLS